MILILRKQYPYCRITLGARHNLKIKKFQNELIGRICLLSPPSFVDKSKEWSLFGSLGVSFRLFTLYLRFNEEAVCDPSLFASPFFIQANEERSLTRTAGQEREKEREKEKERRTSQVATSKTQSDRKRGELPTQTFLLREKKKDQKVLSTEGLSYY